MVLSTEQTHLYSRERGSALSLDFSLPSSPFACPPSSILVTDGGRSRSSSHRPPLRFLSCLTLFWPNTIQNPHFWSLCVVVFNFRSRRSWWTLVAMLRREGISNFRQSSTAFPDCRWPARNSQAHASFWICCDGYLGCFEALFPNQPANFL